MKVVRNANTEMLSVALPGPPPVSTWMLSKSLLASIERNSTANTINGRRKGSWTCQSTSQAPAPSRLAASSGSSSTLLAVSIGSLAAYGFSRFRIPAGQHLFFCILATRLGPPVAYALPMYLVFFKLGLLNLQAGVIVAHATFNLVLVVWMMKSFFDEVPREVEEAAYLDGCTHFQVFWNVSVPLTWPGLVTVSIFVLLFSWNELLFALILSAGEMRTLTVMIPSLVLHTGTLWGEVAAASVVQSIPVLVFTFLVQKHLVRGLTFGAVKG